MKPYYANVVKALSVYLRDLGFCLDDENEIIYGVMSELLRQVEYAKAVQNE